jgi:hypothetical protein
VKNTGKNSSSIPKPETQRPESPTTGKKHRTAPQHLRRHRKKTSQRNIQSPGSQIHSYKRHDRFAELFKNHCQDNLWIKSTASATAPFPLLKILSFRIFQTTQITVNHTVEKSFFILLFFPLCNIIPYSIIGSGGSTISIPNQWQTQYQIWAA